MHSKVKTVLDILLSFFTALTLFMSAACIILVTTVCSNTFLLSKMESSGYYTSNYQKLSTELGYLAEPIGIEADRLTGVLEPDTLRDDVRMSVMSAFEGTDYSPDITTFESRIYDTLLDYAEENRAEIDEDSLENVTHLCGEIYQQHASLSYVGSIGHYASLFRIPLLFAAVICFVICIILIITQISIHRFKHRSLRYIIAGIAGAGLSLSVLPAIALISGKISHLSITDLSLYSLVVNYLNSALGRFIVSGIALLLISVLLWFVYRRTRSKALC